MEMYVNDNTTSRPTGDGNNDFNAVVTGGTFVSAIEDGTYFSIYLWNTTTQSVTLGIDSQYGKIAWFDFVDSAVVNIVENCLADYAEEDYSAANWQAILDILDALETELATVTDVSQIEEKVSAAQAKMAEIARQRRLLPRMNSVKPSQSKRTATSGESARRLKSLPLKSQAPFPLSARRRT